MKWLPLLPVACLAACAPAVAPVAPAPRVIPAGASTDSFNWTDDAAAIERELLVTARERFGEATVRRALATPTYIFAKFYHGMLPPPQPGDPPYKPPMALLVRDNGKWLAATSGGFRPARSEITVQLDTLLASRDFRATPVTGGPGCTDAGASLLMLKVPERPETVRTGTCGTTASNERVAMLALDAARGV
jgi:hypothetical protein